MNELRTKYGPFFAVGQRLRRDAGGLPSIPLRPEKVPPAFRALIPYAEFWGIADDGYREELAETAPPEVWADFRRTVSEYEPALTEWLGGPEADQVPPTDEYVAFSAMSMAHIWPRD